MPRFNERQYKQIATRVGISDKAVKRLLGYLNIVYSSLENTADNTVDRVVRKSYNLGLQLENFALSPSVDKETEIALLTDLLGEYRNLCSRVIKWIIRGDFNPQKIPDNVSKADLLHAARTAGRLKAKFIKSIAAN